MSATVYTLPAGESRDHASSMNMSDSEVIQACGGYVRPADQLRALHARGFVRAWRRPGGPVILERAHHDAVVRGQYGHQDAATAEKPPAPRPNRAALQQRFKGGGK